jgi:hypothetical protein
VLLDGLRERHWLWPPGFGTGLALVEPRMTCRTRADMLYQVLTKDCGEVHCFARWLLRLARLGHLGLLSAARCLRRQRHQSPGAIGKNSRTKAS